MKFNARTAVVCFGVASMAAAGLQADPLADVQARLAVLAASADRPVRVEAFEENTDDRLVVYEGPEGLVVRVSPETVARLNREKAERAVDPAKPSPVRDRLRALEPAVLESYLDATAMLRRELGGAELIGSATDASRGADILRLDLKLVMRLSGNGSKWVKDATATGSLWVDAAGTPVALRKQSRIAGRAYVVFSFESKVEDAFEFALVNGRLIAVRHEPSGEGSGGGETQSEHRVVVLQPVPLPAAD